MNGTTNTNAANTNPPVPSAREISGELRSCLDQLTKEALVFASAHGDADELRIQALSGEAHGYITGMLDASTKATLDAHAQRTPAKPGPDVDNPGEDALEILDGTTVAIEQMIGLVSVAHADGEMSDERYLRFMKLANGLGIAIEGARSTIGRVSR